MIEILDNTDNTFDYTVQSILANTEILDKYRKTTQKYRQYLTLCTTNTRQ